MSTVKPVQSSAMDKIVRRRTVAQDIGLQAYPYYKEGAAIRAAREAERFTQGELGEAIGGSRQTTVSDWEKGVRMVPAHFWSVLSKTLKLPKAKFVPAEPVDGLFEPPPLQEARRTMFYAMYEAMAAAWQQNFASLQGPPLTPSHLAYVTHDAALRLWLAESPTKATLDQIVQKYVEEQVAAWRLAIEAGKR